MNYHTMSTEALADMADDRLMSIPGGSAIPLLVKRLWPGWRVSDGRRPRLIEALERDDLIISNSETREG